MVTAIQRCLTQTLKIQPTDGYKLFDFINKRTKEGLLALYVDDNLAAGLKSFEKSTDIIPNQLESRQIEYPPVLFARINTNSNTNGYFLEQTNFIYLIDTLKTKNIRQTSNNTS